jgi:hypothetical protein
MAPTSPSTATQPPVPVAHAVSHAAVHTATGDVGRIFHFADHGVVIGAIFLLALSFMFWVLWNFWRDSHR